MAHVGIAGARQSFVLEVERVMSHDGDYGLSYLHIFYDAQKNRFIWWTKTKLEEKRTYDITGTVKEHNLYKGVPQTVLTRCSFILRGEPSAKPEQTHFTFEDPPTVEDPDEGLF